MASAVTRRVGSNQLYSYGESPDPNYPGVSGEFECTSDVWDEPFQSDTNLCRIMALKSMTHYSLCKEFLLLGYSNGEVRMGIRFQRLPDMERVERYLAECGCSSIDPRWGQLSITSDIKSLFRMIADNNAIPPLQLEKIRAIVEEGKCDPYPCSSPPHPLERWGYS